MEGTLRARNFSRKVAYIFPRRLTKMETHKLTRSSNEKMIAGVCGGLAEYLAVDPTIVRLIFVVLALIGLHGLLLYLIMWLLMPLKQPELAS
jgi:phage shock protein C